MVGCVMYNVINLLLSSLSLSSEIHLVLGEHSKHPMLSPGSTNDSTNIQYLPGPPRYTDPSYGRVLCVSPVHSVARSVLCGSWQRASQSILVIS